MLQEDPGIFLQDFGKRVVCGSVSGLGIFDRPDEIVAGVAISAEYQVTVEADKFESVATRGTVLYVDGTAYKVQKFIRLGDGTFARIDLESV